MNRLVLVYALIWQAAWWLGFLPASGSHPAFGAIAPLVVVALHLTWRRPPRAWATVLTGLGLAVVVDGSLAALGFVGYARELVPAPWPALWIGASWLLFACGLQRCMSWLRGRFILALILGAIGGPMAYWGAAAFGAIVFNGQVGWALVGVGLGYAAGLPVLTYVAFGVEESGKQDSSSFKKGVARA